MGEVPKLNTESEPTADRKQISWAEFLVTFPPDVRAEVTDLGEEKFSPGTRAHYWDTCAPDLRLYCLVCEGERSFENVDQYPVHLTTEKWANGFLRYCCKNCERQTKLYAFAAKQT